jgi:ribosomal protein S18 acetylase RimI-like enzyme
MKCKEIPRKQTEPLTVTSYGYFDGEVKIGHAALRKRRDGSYSLENVSILEKYRGRGLCTKFLQCIMKKYSDKVIFLDVLIKNEPAIKCYTKLGFKEIDKGRSTLYMRKN